MPAPPETAPRVAVVGGGITGLAAAHRLAELRPGLSLTLFESSGRVGGVLETVRRDGYLIERSADNFLTKTPWAVGLCERLGLSDELLPTNADRRRALIVHNGAVKPTPEGFVIAAPKRLWPLMASGLLSPAGKLRLACEPLVPRRKEATDESVADFARRRLGRETLERLVQPLVGGIYTADLEKLSLAATLPQLRDQEREHGSLWRAARSERRAANAADQPESGARYSAFVAPRGGAQQMIDALAVSLPADALRRQTAVGGLRREGAAWRLTGDRDKPLGLFDGVVLATPAHATARVVDACDKELASELAAIEHASSVVVCLGYRVDQLRSLPNGFGVVVPAREGRKIIAASFASLKFPGRAPEGGLLARVFLGGALQPELCGLDDDELTRIATAELADLLKIKGPPQRLEVARWPDAMPQYHVGHLDRVARIESLVAAHRGVELAGAAYRGVGVPQCIQSGELAAERIASQLFGASPARAGDDG